MKCYIVIYVPDYQGFFIDSIFLDEKKAIERTKEKKEETIKDYGSDVFEYDYIEEEIIE